MSFNPNIPTSTDLPSQSQGQLLANFTALNTIFAVDHLAFNAVDGGEHQQVTFNSVVADPGLADPKCSLYIKTIAGDSELFFEKYDNTAAANLVQQLTNLNITNLVNAGTAGGTLYRIDSPLGFTIFSGQTNAFTGAGTVTFPAAYTTIFTSIATANDANVQKVSSQSALGGLTLHTENSVQVNWVTIGII